MPLQVRTVQGLTVLRSRGGPEDRASSPAGRPDGVRRAASRLGLSPAGNASGARGDACGRRGRGRHASWRPSRSGAQGAPVVDRSGGLRGLVRGGPDERRAVAGIVPPAHYRIDDGRAFRARGDAGHAGRGPASPHGGRPRLLLARRRRADHLQSLTRDEHRHLQTRAPRRRKGCRRTDGAGRRRRPAIRPRRNRPGGHGSAISWPTCSRRTTTSVPAAIAT